MEDYDGILNGDYSRLSRKQSNTVRIFLSSTFGDFIHERNELMRRTFPCLRAYCQTYNLEFQVVDMRWGVRDENITYHQTSDICVQEIWNCQRLSLGPSFIALIGNRYGYRPFPAKIPVSEFSMLLELAAAHEINTSGLCTWFQCDNNSIPPVYQLQPITTYFPHYASKDPLLRKKDRDQWWETFIHLQSLFWQLVDLAVKEKRITSQRAHIYHQSVTEDEIYHGVLSIASPNDHCLCYIREFTDLHDNIPDAIACRYMDSNPYIPTDVDKNAQYLLQQLKEEKIPSTLDQSNITKFSVAWSPGGVEPNKHKLYIQSLCNKVYTDVKRLVDKALATRESKITELHQEILHHANFCLSRCETFCGREDLLLQIHQFIASGIQKPLVIFGPSGCGKTTIMAKSASMIRNWMSQACTTVVRFLGTSPASSLIREVLVSICTQISTVYCLKIPIFSEMDSIEIKQYFCNQFLDLLQSCVSDESQLCIFLDSIDQLSPLDGAHSFNWLPKHLPPNIHIIISMLPDKYNCLKTIRTMLSSEDSYIQVGLLPLHTGIQIMQAWLTKINRTITSEQREILSQVFTLNPQPLYLRLLFHYTQRWHSYTQINKTDVATSTSKAIQQFFTSVEEQYGKVLVQKALGYITAAKSGLTASELEDVLSLDNDVLNEVYQYWDPPKKDLLRLPPLLWKRIQYEISDYLVEQHADGKTVFAWYHRQFVESARAIYLEDEKKTLSIHQVLSEYFEGIWSGKQCKPIALVHRNLTLDKAKRQVAAQPLKFKELVNLRKLNELPYHLLHSKQFEKLQSLSLCNFQWLQVKLTATTFQNVMQDFTLSVAYSDDIDISITGEVLSLSANNLMADANSLAGQLLGRLRSHCIVSKHIQTLTDQAQHWAVSLSGKHQLVPCNSCLISPGGPLKTTLSGHSHLIHKLSMSKTHPLMVSSSKGHHCTIFNVWDVNFLPQYVQNLHTLKINDPDTPYFCLKNEILFGASGHTVTAWNCITGEEVLYFCASQKVSSLTVTPSSQCLLTGMVDGSVLCYDRFSESKFETIAYDSTVNCIETFENEKIVVTASSCGQLGIYNTVLHKHVHTIQAHKSDITCLNTKFHSGTSYVLTGSVDHTVKVWIVSRESLHPLHILAGHTKTVQCITHAHLQTAIVVTGSLDKTIRIWDAFLSGQCLRTLKGHLDGVWCMATILDGPKLVSGSKDDYLKVWDVGTGECLHTLEGHSSWISCVVTATTNDVIISGSNDKTVKIWKLASTRSPATDRHFAQPECIISTNNGLIVSGAPDAIKVWEVCSARCLHTFPSSASTLSVTDDCRYLISGSKDSTISVWELNSFSKIRTINCRFGAVTCIAVLDTNTYLSAHDNGVVTVGDLHSEKYTVMVGHTSGVKCIGLSSDRSIAASGSYDCTVRVWNVLSMKCTAILEGHTKVVWCVTFSNDNTRIASGGDDSIVRVWNISNNCCLLQKSCPDNVKCIALSLMDKVVIAGAHCGQDQLKAWSIATGDCITNYKGHTHAVMCIQIVDDQTLISGSRDGTIKVWDINTGNMLATFDLQSQAKHIAVTKLADKGYISVAATTKTGPIAMFNYHRP